MVAQSHGGGWQRGSDQEKRAGRCRLETALGSHSRFVIWIIGEGDGSEYARARVLLKLNCVEAAKCFPRRAFQHFDVSTADAVSSRHGQNSFSTKRRLGASSGELWSAE